MHYSEDKVYNTLVYKDRYCIKEILYYKKGTQKHCEKDTLMKSLVDVKVYFILFSSSGNVTFI